MTPIEITEQVEGWAKVVYAKDQPEYQPLPTLRQVGTVEGRVLSRWRPTEDELIKLLAGDDLYLEVWTFNNECRRCGQQQGLQPVRLGVWSDRVACVDGSTK